MSLSFTPVSFDYPIPERIAKKTKREAWDLAIPISDNWKKSTKRILFVIDHVPTADLKAKRLISESSWTLFHNVIEHGFKIAKSWGHKLRMEDWGITFVNFSYFKTFDLDIEVQAEANRASVKRLNKVIDKLKPTHIHFFGPQPANLIYDIDVEKRGWVIPFNHGNELQLQICSNVSITSESFFEEDEDDVDSWKTYGDTNEMGVRRANLLGYAADNIARHLHGSYPYSLSHLKPNFEVIDTIVKFDDLMTKLWAAKRFAFDLETFNLSSLANGIVSAQFAFDDKLGYFLLLKHKDSPWSAKQLRYIYTKLREFFVREFDHYDWNTPYIIGQNLMFDMKVLRQELGIPIMHYRIWDIMAGEHAREGNYKEINYKSFNPAKEGKSGAFALNNIFARHENDFYYTAEFSKEQRHTIKDVPITKQVIEYAVMDVIAVYGLHNMERKWAKVTDHNGKSYLKTYCKLILGIYSDTIHSMSHMIEYGVQADLNYITKQYANETSDIIKERQNLMKKLYEMPSAIEANRRLIERASLPTESLFAGTDTDMEMWMFNIDKQDHQKLLFFEVMDLAPVNYTDTGKPSIGKIFQQHYSQANSNHCMEEVKLYSAISESKKVIGFLKGYFVKLNGEDGQIDNRIRSGYGFLIDTGRSNSFDVNLQQVPNHGQYAKLVKRSFVAKDRRLLLKMDFSAHEVKSWCNLSGDGMLARTFRTIWNTFVTYRKNPTKENAEALKLADSHKITYCTFTGTKLEDHDWDSPEGKKKRQSSKNITFGVMFGKAVKSLAKDMGIPEEEMQAIFDQFFGKFKLARRWLDNTIKHGRKYLYVSNAFGFRRNLPGHLAGDRGLSGAMDRRGINAPIQGYSSQLTFAAVRLLLIKLYHQFKSQNMYGEPVWDADNAKFTIEKPAFNLNAMVHDSTETEVSYELAPMVAAAMEHTATLGVMDYCKKMYGLSFKARLAVDFDVGDDASHMNKWDFTKDGWRDVIKKAYTLHVKRTGIKDFKKEAILALKPTERVKEMMKPFPVDMTLYDLKEVA